MVMAHPLAHEPATCERFADKLMCRILVYWRAIERKTGAKFGDRTQVPGLSLNRVHDVCQPRVFHVAL
jgi:hypothetical protein